MGDIAGAEDDARAPAFGQDCGVAEEINAHGFSLARAAEELAHERELRGSFHREARRLAGTDEGDFQFSLRKESLDFTFHARFGFTGSVRRSTEITHESGTMFGCVPP